jgi:dihydroneopterin aldolase / 2-amino-4-hydroxy-6-hydroxymethyldihydropteridine diphosphokinase
MATARIMLSGIRASGRHGANPGEQVDPQEFVVDLDLSVEVHGDDLDATTDYRAIADEARAAIEGNSFQLLETLAEQVAKRVYGLEGVFRVVAVVHKPGAAASLGVDDVSCEAIIA